MMKILILLSATVLLSLPFQAIADGEGCTIGSGYWKTHSICGAAGSRDMTWDSLMPDAEGTPFFLSGLTYCEALHISPKGNAYYILAHSYIAALLNREAGADFTEAMEAFAAATELFNQYTPYQIGLMSGGSTVRQIFLELAATLADFNNGYIGPGSCLWD